MHTRTIPIRHRPGDILIIAFFLFNLLFITYVVDFEQVVIADPTNFAYPAWPPPIAVDIIHHYAQAHDPDILARAAWWRATIWIDVFLFGPFYGVAIYAYLKGRAWIRIPSIIYGSMIITNVLIILMEERFGSTPAPDFTWVLLTNLPWLIMPAYTIYRMWRDPHPFSQPIAYRRGSYCRLCWRLVRKEPHDRHANLFSEIWPLGADRRGIGGFGSSICAANRQHWAEPGAGRASRRYAPSTV